MTIDLSQGILPVSTRVINLLKFLTDSAQRHPQQVGFVWGDRTWSWAEMEARSAAFAVVLRDRYGLRKGDRLLVQSANNNQMFEAMFAGGSVRSGCPPITASPRKRSRIWRAVPAPRGCPAGRNSPITRGPAAAWASPS